MVLVNLANALAARGVRVALLVMTARHAEPLPFRLHPAIEVHSSTATGTLPLLLETWRQLRQLRPGVLVAGSVKAGRIGWLLSWLPGVRPRGWVMLQHSLAAETAGWSRSRRRRRFRLWRRIARRGAGLITVSQGVADELISLTGVAASAVHVVHNPIVTDDFAERAAAANPQHWFRAGEPPVILGVGRLTAQKDFATLVRAFARVRQHGRYRLMITGEGEERDALRALADELGVGSDIALPGFVANPLPVMRDACVLAMPSAWEGFGNVLVEAMFCGTPVVSTDCPQGPREVLDHGRYGRLVPVADAAALADAIIATVDAPPDPAELRRRAEQFSVAAAVDRYQALLGLGAGAPRARRQRLDPLFADQGQAR